MSATLTLWSTDDMGPKTGLMMERKNFRIRPKVVRFIDIGPWMAIADIGPLIRYFSARNPDYEVGLSDDMRSIIGTRRDLV